MFRGRFRSCGGRGREGWRQPLSVSHARSACTSNRVQNATDIWTLRLPQFARCMYVPRNPALHFADARSELFLLQWARSHAQQGIHGTYTRQPCDQRHQTNQSEPVGRAVQQEHQTQNTKSNDDSNDSIYQPFIFHCIPRVNHCVRTSARRGRRAA